MAEFSKGRVPKVIEDLGDPSCLDWDYIPRPNALPGLQTDASALPALFDTSGLQGLEEFLREDDTFMWAKLYTCSGSQRAYTLHKTAPYCLHGQLCPA